METNLKLHSVTRRWLMTVLPVVLLVIVVCEIVVCVFVFRFYRDSVSNHIKNYVRDIDVLSMVDGASFADTASDYAKEFKYRDKVELQIFDSGDNMLVTTNGFVSKLTVDNAVDYFEAKKSGGEATFMGKNENGENILAVTSILPDLGYGTNGAYRVLVSMESVLVNCYATVAVAIAVGVLMIGILFFSGLFFIGSVLHPVREVTAAARRIATGDMKSKLEVKHNDEIGELCDTINYMASELENAEKVKNDFISSVSHELRTPLTAIKGWGETVSMSIGEDDEIVRRGVEIILDESNRLSGLVEELLDFSRLESGKMTFTMSLCDPAYIVGTVVRMYEEIAKQNKLELEFSAPSKCEFVMADPDRIKQVFINTIDNAVKYTSSGGRVAVSVNNEEGCVRITISDTGCGISAKDINHVKEKFYKANSNVRGSGIGLAVADEIVRHHNGLLFIESTEGKGTTVTVVIPTVKVDEALEADEIFPPLKKG
ncbi:MAG: HAMP domain-containing histidine kinase [Ruminococcaceae bacterium]|nr:HAMP domain-containing histidine kinase [Oscillospiraceae bacterium]